MDSAAAAGGGQNRPTGRLIAEVVRALRGWVVAIAGGVLLLGAYLGISKETDVSRQVPYLVSGGLGGLALVIVGAALLVADKIETTRDAAGARVARQVDDLYGLIVAAAGAPAVGAEVAEVERPPAHAAVGAVGGDAATAGSRWGADRQNGGSASADTLVAVPSGRSYHRASCELVAGKPAQPVAAAEIATRGLSPCPVCDPPAAA